MTKVLVTGGSGFVGQRLLNVLINKKYSIRSAYYKSIISMDNLIAPDIEWVKCNLVDDNIDYSKLFFGVDVIVHLAGLAHVLKQDKHTIELFRKVNIDSTEKLAKAAAANGVKQFIFISSIKVNGETAKSNLHHQYTYINETEKPVGQYAISKSEAENRLKEICNLTGMRYTIFRPPLLYGPGVKANFLKIIKLIDKGIPLPLAGIENKRSMLYVDNLCHAIEHCINKDYAGNELFFIKDIDCSTVQLIKVIANALGKPQRLFSFPISLLKLCAIGTGRRDQFLKLTESLMIDDSHIRQTTGWIPDVNFDDAIKTTIDWYKK
jgi:nucleoside-diphosphate-sugar epimerase